MICEACKFDNREGALFCAECGKPLASANPEKSDEKDADKTVLLDKVVTSSKESVEGEDESESNTTVLTSNMIKPAQAVAPQGFVAAPTASKPATPQQPVAPQMAPGKPAAPQQPVAPQMAPTKPAAPQQPVAPQMVPGKPAAPQQPVAPQVTPQPQMAQGKPAAPQQSVAPQMAPQPQVTPQPQMAQGKPAVPQQPATPQMAPQAPNKPVASEENSQPTKKEIKVAKKADKKENKGKMGTGTKVYIVLSIILILALGGVIAYGYFVFHADKMEKAQMEKEELIASYTDQLNQKDTEIANANAATLEAQATVSNYEMKLEESQQALEASQAIVESYVAYDPLINFVETCSADSSTDMLVSDTVVYAQVGSEAVIYVYFPSQEGGTLNYLSSDKNIVDCEWGDSDEWIDGCVLPLKIKALSAGDITIDITNDKSEANETVFVHVE